jgi:hypothetical protein
MRQFGALTLRIIIAGASVMGSTIFLIEESLDYIEYTGFEFGSFAVVWAIQALPFALYVALVRGRAVSLATGMVMIALLVYTSWWTATSIDAQAGLGILSGAWAETLLVILVSALQVSIRVIRRLVPAVKLRWTKTI